MKLISSRETVNFLAQAAPRPWVQRMLLWMLLNDELIGYATSGRIQPHSTLIEIASDLLAKVGFVSGPTLDEAIEEVYEPPLAAKLMGKGLHDRINDEPHILNESDGPHSIDPGYFLFATEINWESGTLSVEWIPSGRERWDALFPTEDMLGSEFDNAEFEVRFEGVSFEFGKIEMLLPNSPIATSAVLIGDRAGLKRSAGRPAKWDWEGALAYMVSQAQSPDGLPTGAGAQARIEEMIADWFVQVSGDAPSPSQIRERAASIIRMVEKPKKVERGL